MVNIVLKKKESLLLHFALIRWGVILFLLIHSTLFAQSINTSTEELHLMGGATWVDNSPKPTTNNSKIKLVGDVRIIQIENSSRDQIVKTNFSPKEKSKKNFTPQFHSKKSSAKKVLQEKKPKKHFAFSSSKSNSHFSKGFSDSTKGISNTHNPSHEKGEVTKVFSLYQPYYKTEKKQKPINSFWKDIYNHSFQSRPPPFIV